MGSRDASNVFQTTVRCLASMCDKQHPHIQRTACKLGTGLRQLQKLLNYLSFFLVVKFDHFCIHNVINFCVFTFFYNQVSHGLMMMMVSSKYKKFRFYFFIFLFNQKKFKQNGCSILSNTFQTSMESSQMVPRIISTMITIIDFLTLNIVPLLSSTSSENILTWYWILLANILLKIQASTQTSETGLQFSFLLLLLGFNNTTN